MSSSFESLEVPRVFLCGVCRLDLNFERVRLSDNLVAREELSLGSKAEVINDAAKPDEPDLEGVVRGCEFATPRLRPDSKLRRCPPFENRELEFEAT